MKTSKNQRRSRSARILGSSASFAVEALERRALLNAYIVTNVNNNGDGSLRDAITQANANPGSDSISFNIAGSGVQTISPTSQLPQITDPLTIDGTTQPGYAGTPLIELNGSVAGTSNGLEFIVGGNTVAGLDIDSFFLDGIVFAEPTGPNPIGGNMVIKNYIGTDPTGTIAKANEEGIHLIYSPHDLIKSNLISGNAQSGVFVADKFSTDTHIEENMIGTTVTGLSPLPNKVNGVALGAPPSPATADGFASGNFVGGSGEGNVISGNGNAGVWIEGGTNNTVQGNFIGVGGDGATPLGNGSQSTPATAQFGSDGVFINGGSNNLIGGGGDGQGNIISANTGDGVRIDALTGISNDASNNKVQGNYIGTNSSGNGAKGLGNVNGIEIRNDSGSPQVVAVSNNLIGGDGTEVGAISDSNVISGNVGEGIGIGGAVDGTKVEGNFIGTNLAGEAAVGNLVDGISLGAIAGQTAAPTDTTIGGSLPDDGNVISGNGLDGIFIGKATGVDIYDNLIGTDGTGTVALSNGFNGMEINNASDVNVGGISTGATPLGNIISGSGQDGVLISASTDCNIAGNYIGTDITGIAPLPNKGNGLEIGSSSGMIVNGNFIGNSGATGILINDNSSGNSVTRDYVGVGSDGKTSQPNGVDGVAIANGSSGNTIGGPSAANRNVISANVEVGVQIQSLATGNSILGNYIGTNADGEFVAGLGNLFAGVGIDGANNNTIQSNTIRGNNVGIGIIDSAMGNKLFGNIVTNSTTNGIAVSKIASSNMIGGPDDGDGNYIGTDNEGNYSEDTGNAGAGVDIRDATNNTVQNNSIRGNANGVVIENSDTQGNTLLGNSISNNTTDGVQIINGAFGNTIGGTAVGTANVISANTEVGVQILSLAHDNTVIGNYIGTDENGDFIAGDGNLFAGVGIDGASNNTIQDNAIRGNSVGIGIIDSATGNKLFANIVTNSTTNGIAISKGASGNMVGGPLAQEGNIIGTDDDGNFSEDTGNAAAGVDIRDASSNTVQKNVIRGNATGVLIEQSDTQGNTVVGNTITNNTSDGVQITAGAFGNTIGGKNAGDSNIISINTEVGVQILSLSHDNTIIGNYIGTDDTGQFAEGFGNLFAGVGIDGANNNTVQGNAIRGNAVGIGVIDSATGNKLFGNFVTNSTTNGIAISQNALNNMIGGPDAGDGNDIGTDDSGNFAAGDGNTGAGVDLRDATGNTVQDNEIRGNATGVLIENADTQGNTLLGNDITNSGADGVQIINGAFANTVGGTGADDANLISSNATVGVEILSASHDNKVIENDIGTDDNGDFADGDGNLFSGVGIDGANNNTVQGNTIRGNTVGIGIIDGGTGNALRGNIVTNSTDNGIDIKASSNNVIGGPSDGDGNSISLNAGAGVFVESGTGDAILHNNIFNNTGLGIDLAPDGVTLNDPQSALDADTGPNNLQNFPELTLATTGGSNRIVGTLSSAANSVFILEFFNVDDPDPSGYGQGDRYLTTIAVTTNASGIASFDVPLPAGVLPQTFISATATDANGNTSEFSKAVIVDTDTDGDGIPDDMESDGPNDGDGNDDGIPDSQQANVATFVDAVSSRYITLEVPAGMTLSNVTPIANPSPDDAPDASFDLGLYSFKVNGVAPGGAVAVQVYLPEGSDPTDYYRYGPVPGNPTSEWYDWLYNGQTGAQINGNHVTLNFIDGQFGDDDAMADGTVTDPGGPAFPVRFTVTNTNDSGPGSLRQAILNSNKNHSPDFIDFDIAGGGVQTIIPLSTLPTITNPVTIDGTTQPGYAGKPLIELDGASAPGDGFDVFTSGTTIRGLVINRFSGSGISALGLTGGSINFANLPPVSVTITGDYIGTDVTGLLARPNGTGVILGGLGGFSFVVGGTSAADRNVISGNLNNGIFLTGGGTGFTIQGNYIGVGADGVTPLANSGDGVYINTGGYLGRNPLNVLVGGPDAIDGNVIADNVLDGIEYRTDGQFLSNSVYGNGALGIGDFYQNVLNDSGVNDGTSSPQNYPVLSSAISSGGKTVISGYLNTLPDQTYIVQFFSNPTVSSAGYGQGRTYLGSTSVTTDDNGHVDFTATLGVTVANGQLITSTATGSGNVTSNFSVRIAVGDVLGNVFVVNTTDDTDDGATNPAHMTLRDAIFDANNHPGLDTIEFDIPGGGVQTIAPLTPLPAIIDSVIIDGTSQPGYIGTPLIQVVGTKMEHTDLSGSPLLLTGLYVDTNGSTVKGLDINSFYLLGTGSTASAGSPLIVAGNNNVIEGNFIGTDPTGTVAVPNILGLSVTGTGNVIGGTTPAQRNIISGNYSWGLTVTGDGPTLGTATGPANIIEGNFIGTDVTGTKALANGIGTAFNSFGLTLRGANILGGAAPGAGNVISGNNGVAVMLTSGEGSIIQGNFIGTDVTGTKKIGNSGYGIEVYDNDFDPTTGVTIGGTLAGEGNIVSDNNQGIGLFGSLNVVQGNLIGTDITGTISLGNFDNGIVLGDDANTIGGPQAGAGNLISGNGEMGILLDVFGQSSGTVIQGNRIGTQADGVSPLGNAYDGIGIAPNIGFGSGGTGPSGDLIGGIDSGDGNTIAFNGHDGVEIVAGQDIGILSNAIYSNAFLGIDLGANGPTANDPDDVDTGANNLQNFPVLGTVVTDGVHATVTGTFNSAPNTVFLLQFFANPAADPSGFGQGQTFLGTRQVVTDSSGNATFTFTFSTAVPVGQFVSATATDPQNDTSEFAATIPVVGGTVTANQPPTANVGGPYTINEGESLTLDASRSSDPDGDPLTYSWDINGDGVFGDATGVKPTLTWAQLNALGITNGPSAFNVSVRVNDGQGHVVTSSPVALAVLNVAPTADAGPDQSVNEEDTVNLAGTFTDPGTFDTHTFDWHVVADNGQVIADGSGTTFSFVPDDTGNYAVTFTVTDSDGGVGTSVVNVYSNDVPPVANFGDIPDGGTIGLPINLTSTVTDISPVATVAGFQYDWGAYLPDDDDVFFSGSTPNFSFTPTVPGDYQIFLIVSDKDGGEAQISTDIVVVAANSAVPTVTVSDSGGIFTGLPFIATTTVAGSDNKPGDSLEGVTPTLTYYSGTTATGTPLVNAPSAVGTYTVVANFAGSADYAAAMSDPVTFKITPAKPTVAVSDAGGKFTSSAFAAKATVAGINGIPAVSLEGTTPTLTYYSGSTATGTPLSGAPSIVGTYTVVASFAGSADYASASSSPVTFNITAIAPTVTAADVGGKFTGTAYAAAAFVNGVAALEGVSPTLTYYSGSTASGTPLTAAPSTVGIYTVMASFAGSADYSSVTSSPVTFSITPATPAVTVADIGGTYNGSAFEATDGVNGAASLEGVTPTLNFYSGSTATGTPLGGAPTTVGTYTVVAIFNGSADYSSSASSPATFSITPATPIVTASDVGGTYNGTTFPATAKVNGSVSLEGVIPTLAFYSGSTATGTPLAGAPSAAGTYTVVASFAGSGDYASALSIPITFKITPATPTVTVSDTGGMATGTPYPATALVNGAASLEGVTPTVTYYNGNTPSGTPLAGAPTAAGTYTVVANFAGSADYAIASSTPVTFVISSLSVPIVTASDAGGEFTGAPFPAIALVNGAATLEGVAPTLAYYTGSTATGTPLGGAPTTVGTYAVVASFAGSIDYSSATSSPIRFTITAATPIVTASDAGGTYNSASFPAAAKVNGAASLEGVIPTLTYYSGSTPIGTPLAGAPSAAGIYTAVANFAGSADYSTAASAPVTFTIASATPSVAVSETGGTYTGSTFAATAKVNGATSLEGIIPTLAYYSGSTANGTPLAGAPSTVGTYTVVASFAGSADYTSGSSAPVTFSITPATPTVTVSDVGGQANGSSYPATATVNGASILEGVSPTVTYYNGSTATGTPLTAAPSAAGTYTVVASFAGSVDYTSANSSPVTFSIASATPTVTVSDAGGAYTGSAYPATAQVNGTASLEGVAPTVTYYAGSNATGTPLSGAPVSIGIYTVVASFAGSTNFASAQSGPLTFSITAVTPTVTVSDTGGVFTGSAYTAVARVNGFASLEGVTPSLIYYAGNVATGTPLAVAPITVGTYTVVANFAGSPDYAGAKSSPLTFTISPATPTIIVSDAGGKFTGAPYPATALINGLSTLEGVAPTLTYYTGNTTSGTPLAGAPSAVGTYTVVATFAGSADYANGGSSPLTFNVTQATPTVTVSDAGGNFTGATYPATALVNGATSLEGINPTFSYYNGGAATGTALSGAPSAAGTYTVVASFAGSTDYAVATSSPVTFSIGSRKTPTVTVSDVGGTFTGKTFPATARVNGASSLEGVSPTLTYYSGGVATGTPLAGAPSAAGAYTVVANFAGSADYAAASSAPVIFIIAKATPKVMLNTGCGSYTYSGSPIDLAATVTGVNGKAASTLEDVTPTLTYYLGKSATGPALASAPTNAGTYTVVASFAGSTDYKAASTSATFTIGKATPTVVVAAPSAPGASATATVTGIGGAKITDGAVTFKYYLAGDYRCASPLTSAPAKPGSYLVVAYFSGDANYTASQSAITSFTIAKATPIVVAVPPKTPGSCATAIVTGIGGAKITDGVVLFEYFLATDTKCAHALSSPPTKAGSYFVIAYFFGDASYSSAQSEPTAFTIHK